MRIWTGTLGADGPPCQWVQCQTMWKFDLGDLIKGLGWHYWRYRGPGAVPLPEVIGADLLVGIVKQVYERVGTDRIWSWADELDGEDEVARAADWCRSMVLAVLPELEIRED